MVYDLQFTIYNLRFQGLRSAYPWLPSSCPYGAAQGSGFIINYQLSIVHHNLATLHSPTLLVEELHSVVAVGEAGAVDLDVGVVAVGLVDQTASLIVEGDFRDLRSVVQIDVQGLVNRVRIELH